MAAKHIIQVLVISCFLHLIVHAQTQIQPPLTEFNDLACTLITLKTQREREELLEKKKELMTPDLRKVLIQEGNTQLMAGRYSTAFDIYGLAQNIADQIGDREGVATALLDIGSVYYLQADYPAALEQYKKARELFVEVKNQYEAAKALSGLALIYKEQRRDADALAALQQVLQEFTAIGDKDEASNTLNTIGAIYYGQRNFTAAAAAFSKSAETNTNIDSIVRLADALYMQGDYLQALNYYKQSLDRSPVEIGVTVAALTGAANSAYYLGIYDDALQNYERLVAMQKNQTDKLGLANALKGIGNVHRSRGNYGLALENYFNSLPLFEEVKAPIGSTLGSIGLVRALQGDYPRALEYYGKALKEFEANANTVEMARVLTLIGNAHYGQGRYDLALVSYQKALSLREQMDDKSGQGEILAGIGSTLLRQKNYAEALDSFQKAAGLFNAVKNRKRLAKVLTLVSEAFLLQNDNEKALAAAESATTIAAELDSRDTLWYARTLAGKAHAKLDHAPQTYTAFTGAISVVESLRSQPVAVSSSEENSSLPYLSAIDFLISQHRTSEAFQYAEREKTQRLIEMLKAGNARSSKSLSSERRVEEQRLTGKLTLLKLQIEREDEQQTPNETRRSELRQSFQDARVAYAAFLRNLYKTNPSVKVARGELEPPALDDLRSLINDTGTALLEYTITDSNTYLFVLTADRTVARGTQRRSQIEINLKVYPLEVRRHELAAAVSHFEQLLSTRDNNYQQSARELYDLLVRPAADQIGLKTKLMIVPDGPLWQLPFDALQPADNYYVADDMEVSYAPSLSMLREMRRLRAPAHRPALTVAYANPALAASFSSRLELAHPGLQLQTSATQEQESRQVAASYGSGASRLFAGGAANQEQVRSELPRADIVHFATPVLLDDISPLSSFVGLSPSANQDDGLLEAREILNLQSTAKLVVFSDATNSGGVERRWPVGWSWAWFVAGTRATMVNRWTIEPAARLAFLNKFYSSLKPAGRLPVSKARALRQSSTTIRRTPGYEHPYYWANFALIGDSR
jgi:CHAT domain-containing protein